MDSVILHIRPNPVKKRYQSIHQRTAMTTGICPSTNASMGKGFCRAMINEHLSGTDKEVKGFGRTDPKRLHTIGTARVIDRARLAPEVNRNGTFELSMLHCLAI